MAELLMIYTCVTVLTNFIQRLRDCCVKSAASGFDSQEDALTRRKTFNEITKEIKDIIKFLDALNGKIKNIPMFQILLLML